MIFAQSPGSVISTPIHAEIERDGPSVFSPSLRLAFERRSSGVITRDLGRARFAWSLAELDGCPLRVSLSSAFFVRPCVGVEAGALAASGEAIAHAHDASRTWLAARVLIRFELRLLDTLCLRLHLGAALPLIRDEFSFDPATATSTEIYRAPAVLPLLALDLGVLFW